METYKNDYTKKEDETLWEIHEIRHALHNELSWENIADINRGALEKFEEWKRSSNTTIDKPA